MTTTTPTDRLAATETRHAQVRERLEAAVIARDHLRQTLAKERESYLAATAAAELDDCEQPSRARQTELEGQLPDAEDRIEVLERVLADVARQVRHARADVLTEQAAAVLAETARRQARIHELEPQVVAMQSEITEHSGWILNVGPVKAWQLEREAAQLRGR